jgi:hypothetical protein
MSIFQLVQWVFFFFVFIGRLDLYDLGWFVEDNSLAHIPSVMSYDNIVLSQSDSLHNISTKHDES